MLFCANIANLVIAPQAVVLRATCCGRCMAPNRCGTWLIPMGFVGFWAAWHYWRCAKYLR